MKPMQAGFDELVKHYRDQGLSTEEIAGMERIFYCGAVAAYTYLMEFVDPRQSRHPRAVKNVAILDEELRLYTRRMGDRLNN